jgi:5-methylcytosine-specific restriction endonuclease McrA
VERANPLAPDLRTVDHFIPRSKRGTNVLDNLVIACQRCNGERGDRDADEWMRVLDRAAEQRCRAAVVGIPVRAVIEVLRAG